MPENPSPEDLKRQFEAAISGMELDELRDLTQTLLAHGRPSLRAFDRPALRRPPLPEPVTFRVRVDLDHSSPPIWRRLDIHANATLDVVHEMLQAAFGWSDSHLHRFALSGGITDAGSLAEVLDDPAHFDVDEVNQALRDPSFVLREAGIDPRLVKLANRLRYSETGDDLVARLMSLARPVVLPSLAEMQAALGPVTWFLERASGDGMPLTSAGYLKPSDVEEICAILPTMPDWFGKNNRETHAHPLQEFRAWLQAAGLLRKYKGELLTTRAGAKVRDGTGALWDYLASRLIPTSKGDFAEQSALLIVAHVASSPNEEVPFDTIARTLGDLGWRREDRTQLADHDLYRVDRSPLPLLNNVGVTTNRSGFREPVHPAAAALAHYALLAQDS